MKYLISLLGLCLSLSIMADDHSTNTQKEYFDNGKPKFEVTYKNGKKDGMKRSISEHSFDLAFDEILQEYFRVTPMSMHEKNVLQSKDQSVPQGNCAIGKD